MIPKNYSNHAISRLVERKISIRAVDLILHYGKALPTTQGRNIIQLPESPFLYHFHPELNDLRMATVILSTDQEVVTAFWMSPTYRAQH